MAGPTSVASGGESAIPDGGLAMPEDGYRRRGSERGRRSARIRKPAHGPRHELQRCCSSCWRQSAGYRARPQNPCNPVRCSRASKKPAPPRRSGPPRCRAVAVRLSADSSGRARLRPRSLRAISTGPRHRPLRPRRLRVLRTRPSRRRFRPECSPSGSRQVSADPGAMAWAVNSEARASIARRSAPRSRVGTRSNSSEMSRSCPPAPPRRPTERPSVRFRRHDEGQDGSIGPSPPRDERGKHKNAGRDANAGDQVP